MKQKNPTNNPTDYFEMALRLYKEGKEDFRELQRMSKEIDLKSSQSFGLEKVEILSAGDLSCAACRQLSGKIFTVKEALEKMPLPNENCAFQLRKNKPIGWCRCVYVPFLR